MNAMKKMLLMLILTLTSSAAVQGATWDLLNETYGNGAGQVPFVSSYKWPWNGGKTASETLYDGYASLSISSGVFYACRQNGTINLPADQWRIDVTMQIHNAMGFSFYLGDRDDTPATKALMQVNAAYSETVAHPNVITDYNLRIANDGEIQPAGFDGSGLHTYSFRWDGSAMMFYLDGSYVTTLLSGAAMAGADAGYEACQFGLGAGKSAGPGTVDFYSVRVASVVPEPLSLTLLALGGLLGLRRR